MEKQLHLPEWAAGKGGWLVGVHWADYSAPRLATKPSRAPQALRRGVYLLPEPGRRAWFCASTVCRWAGPAGVRAASAWEEQTGAPNSQPRAEALWGLLLMLEAFIELQHLSWVFAAGAMQAYKGRAGSSPRAQSGTAPAVFGCHMEDHTKHVQPIPLPAMQRNLNYVYPQIFWVDGCANTSTSCPPAPPGTPFPPPVPDRRRKPRDNNRERRSVGFLVISLLILLALTGVGLSMFQIFHLEKQLAELREVRSTWLVTGAMGEQGGGKKNLKLGLRCSGGAKHPKGQAGGIELSATPA